VDYVQVTQVKDQSRAVLNMVTEFHRRRRISWIAGQQSVSQKHLCSMEFSYRFIYNVKRTNEWKSYVKQELNINYSECIQSLFWKYKNIKYIKTMRWLLLLYLFISVSKELKFEYEHNAIVPMPKKTILCIFRRRNYEIFMSLCHIFYPLYTVYLNPTGPIYDTIN
jgi:hypothetical protein